MSDINLIKLELLRISFFDETGKYAVLNPEHYIKWLELKIITYVQPK